MMSLVRLQTETTHTLCMHKHKKHTHINHYHNISFVHYRLLLVSVPFSHEHKLVKAASCGWHWCLCSVFCFVKSRTENTHFLLSILIDLLGKTRSEFIHNSVLPPFTSIWVSCSKLASYCKSSEDVFWLVVSHCVLLNWCWPPYFLLHFCLLRHQVPVKEKTNLNCPQVLELLMN